MEAGRIPNKLRFFRRLCGYSQKKVARLLGLGNTSALSRWEHGNNTPNIKTLFKLSQIYQVFPHELYPTLWTGTSPSSSLSALQSEHITNNSTNTMDA